MLEAIFPSGIDEITVDGLTQWDKGQILRIDFPDMPTLYEVHFAFKGGKEALIVHVLDGAASNEVAIPDELLQQPYDLVAYVYLVGSDGSGETVKTVHLPLERRPKPEDYTDELTPTQAERIDALLAEIHGQSNHAVETAEGAKEKAENAVDTANTASKHASSAQAAAENSATASENSAKAAEAAQNAAESAQTAAENSATAASNAQTAAEAAEAAAKQIAADWEADNEAVVQHVNGGLQTVGGETLSLTKLAVGSWVGTGTYGESNPTKITFGFAPKIVFFFDASGAVDGLNGSEGTMFLMSTFTTSYSSRFYSSYTSHVYMKRSSDGKTLYMYASNANSQLNYEGMTYRYAAIG